MTGAGDDGRGQVVVTGAGLMSAAGSSMAALGGSLSRRRHCLRPISSFETTGLTATHAGEVTDFAPLDYLSPSRVSTLDRGTQLALAAARQALAQAALAGMAVEETGVAVGLSGSTQYQNMRVTADRRYPISRHSALYAARATPSFQADTLARQFGLGGPRFAFGAASLGGLLALSHAMDLLLAGHAQAMLVGGGEINTLVNALGMGALGVTAIGPCTPFAAQSGICFGEGAAFFVLERRADAERRGAPLLGELAGTGISADAYGDVAQDPSGAGLARAVRKCLENGSTEPGAIGWVRCCGTGQRELDAAEAIGLNAAFAGDVPPVTSTEPYFSHVNGVSPLLGLAAALSALASGDAPVLPEGSVPRPGLSLTLLRTGALPEGDCLLTATAFGGTNGAVVVRRPRRVTSPRPAASVSRIAIAGMGAVSTFGSTVFDLLEGVRDPAKNEGGTAFLVDDSALGRLLPGIRTQRRERLVRMALLAVGEALATAAMPVRGSARIGLLVGLTRGPAAAYERFFEQVLQGRFDISTGRMLLRVGRFSVASEIAHAFGLLGYSGAMAPGVHGGVQLLAHGAEILRASADLDGLLVVAADEWTGLMERLYGQLGLLGDGAAYDPAASGCRGGEGAAAVLLCRRAPGEAVPGDWVTVGGTGFAGDTGPRPDPKGRAYRRAIATAIGRAGQMPADIDFAIGQGCGWPAHDRRELEALRPLCPQTEVTSVLPMTGLAESAGGLFGAIAAAAALRDGNLPEPHSSARRRSHLPPRHGLLLGSSERGAHAAVVLSRVAS